jgi:hypothetical protein
LQTIHFRPLGTYFFVSQDVPSNLVQLCFRGRGLSRIAC